MARSWNTRFSLGHSRLHFLRHYLYYIWQISWKKWDFAGDNFKPSSFNQCRTCMRRHSSSSSVSMNTIRSSRNTKTSLRLREPIHFSMTCWKVEGVFVTPWGIQLNSQKSTGGKKSRFVFVLFDYLHFVYLRLVVARFQIHNGKQFRACESSKGLACLARSTHPLWSD